MFTEEIIKKIKNDGVGVIPTDTLYGVIGSAFSKKAVKRIYEIKKRNDKKPFIILISALSDLKNFGIILTNKQKDFLNSTWPNPVSVILPCPQKKFEYLHRGTKSLAFRFPKNKKLADFIKKTGPIVAPSANIEGDKPANGITRAKKYFGDRVDFYVKGTKKEGKPSRIISLLSEKPEIIRK